MSESTDLKVHIAEFSRLIHSLKSVDVRIEEEDRSYQVVNEKGERPMLPINGNYLKKYYAWA